MCVVFENEYVFLYSWVSFYLCNSQPLNPERKHGINYGLLFGALYHGCF